MLIPVLLVTWQLAATAPAPSVSAGLPCVDCVDAPLMRLRGQSLVLGRARHEQLDVPGKSPAGEQPAGDALTLAAAVTQARKGSPRRQSAAAIAEAARDAVRYAGRLPNPTFELRSENWTSSSAPLAPDLDVFAVVTQPLELGGRRGIRRRLATADGEVAAAALGSVERELALEAARTYVRALKARALVATLASNREGLSALVESVATRVREGYSAEADLLKFRTEAARIDGDIARARVELERSLAALSVVIGSAAPVRAGQLVDPPALGVPVAESGALAASIARHPDVVAAAAALDRARQLTAYERARGLPEPLVSGGYKRTAGFDTAVAAVTLAVPIFERNQAAVARAVGAERSAAFDRDAIVQLLTLEAAALIRAARTIAEEAAKAPSDLLAPAEDVRRAARAAFREGSADVLRLIDAERVYADVQRAAIELRLDALLTTIEARFAIGEETIP